MKKKIIIPIIAILIIGIVCFIFWNNRTVATITLDINPSIQINLNKKGKVKKVIPLNEDAKEIISNDLRGNTLDDALGKITGKVIEKGYTNDKQVTILLYSFGNIDSTQIENKVRESFGIKDIYTEIIVIENVTKEDQALAKKYNISPAKASYINLISKDNENIDLVSLTDKPVNELKETKDTGKYCDLGYNLEGDFCLKEIDRKTASDGLVCPEGYYEYDNECYLETGIQETDKLVCHKEFSMNGTKCSRTITIEAEPIKYTCSSGEMKTRAEMGLTDANAGDANQIVCVDYSSVTHPVSPCEAHDGTEYTMANGKCYWHRAPVIAEGCPGKVQVNGECWDDATGIYICVGYRDGKRYSSRDEYCEHSIKYIEPTVTEYKCPNDYTLNGSKCEKQEEENVFYERVCPIGYTKLENDRCIKKDRTTEKITGLVCNGENTKLQGNTCIIYEIVEAKHG